jgi:hypothetical protein
MRERPPRTRLAAVLAGTLLLAGCTTAAVFYTHLAEPPHPLTPHRVEDVEVLVVTPPTAPHVDVGLFQVTSGQDAPTAKDRVARLRAEAAAIGCDAVLITGVENQATRDSRPSVQGSCIVYKQRPTEVGKP